MLNRKNENTPNWLNLDTTCIQNSYRLRNYTTTTNYRVTLMNTAIVIGYCPVGCHQHMSRNMPLRKIIYRHSNEHVSKRWSTGNSIAASIHKC